MSMSWSEHVKQAELLLRETEQDLPALRDVELLLKAQIHVQMALAHAQLATVKQVVK